MVETAGLTQQKALQEVTKDFCLLNSESKRARILIVDDQPINIHALHQLFSDEYEIFMATSAEQALEVCEQQVPDLVLLDVVMPAMSGLDLCRRLKRVEDTHHIPVIFVTAHDDQESQLACWEAGGVDFVVKPVLPETVKHRVRVHLTLKFQTDLLRGMVFLDGLTGIANRRFFDEQLEAAWKSSIRAQNPLAVLMVDIDYFKQFNDNYGHLTGDECLARVAAVIKHNLKRPRDLAARYGGEEFCCILPDTDLQGALRAAQCIAGAIADLEIEHRFSEADDKLSVSIGVAATKPAEADDQETLLKRADKALYRAKEAGRARIMHDAQ